MEATTLGHPRAAGYFVTAGSGVGHHFVTSSGIVIAPLIVANFDLMTSSSLQVSMISNLNDKFISNVRCSPESLSP